MISRFKIFAVILVLAGILLSGLSGCALNQKGYPGDWRDAKAAPLESVHPEAVTNEVQPISDFNSRMLATMNRLDQNVDRLSDLLEGKKAVSVPARKEAKKPKPGVFSQAKKEPAISATPPKDQVEKATAVKKYVSATCVAEIKNRIARLEDMNSDKGAGSVYFLPADSYLCPQTITWLEKNIVARWFNGEIDVTGVNGYASLSKPKDPNMTNIDYARVRTIRVVNYLRSRGIQHLDENKINIKGPTTRFGNNLNVTVVWNEIQNEPEQKTRKEERKQYKVGP